jgi:transcriptional regulator with XRE-family HTH domain
MSVTNCQDVVVDVVTDHCIQRGYSDGVQKARNYLKEIRERAGLSLEDVASQLGARNAPVDRQTVWRWETSRRRLPPEMVQKLADILRCDQFDLTDGPVQLSPEDREVLIGYHGLKEDQRELVRGMLDTARKKGQAAE